VGESGKECDPQCIDHYRNCVPRGIVDPTRPDEIIDCSVPQYKLRCPNACNICTPCEYVKKSEYSVVIQGIQSEDSALELRVKNLEQRLNQYNQAILRPVLLTPLKWSSSAYWSKRRNKKPKKPKLHVGLSVDGKKWSGHWDCFHTKYKGTSQNAVYTIPLSYVDYVKVLIRRDHHTQMRGSYAQVCQKNGRHCQRCTSFSPIKGGNWARSNCENKQGTEVRVRQSTNNYIVICEIQIYGASGVLLL